MISWYLSSCFWLHLIWSVISFMLLQMALFCSFLWRSRIPLSIHTITSISIFLLLDIRLYSHFGYGEWRSPGVEMAIHSSILAWKIPWTEEPSGLQSMELQKVRHDWALTQAHTPYTCLLGSSWRSNETMHVETLAPHRVPIPQQTLIVIVQLL